MTSTYTINFGTHPSLRVIRVFFPCSFLFSLRMKVFLLLVGRHVMHMRTGLPWQVDTSRLTTVGVLRQRFLFTLFYFITFLLFRGKSNPTILRRPKVDLPMNICRLVELHSSRYPRWYYQEAVGKMVTEEPEHSRRSFFIWSKRSFPKHNLSLFE